MEKHSELNENNCNIFQNKNSGISFEMLLVAALIASQSFLYGYVMAGLNSILVTGDNKNDAIACYNNEDTSCPKGTLYNDIHMKDTDAQLATTITVIGAWIGCFAGSHPSEMMGRRNTLLCNNAFFIVGAIIMGSAKSPIALFLGRFLSGFAVGVESMLVPVFLSEISPPESRGSITTMHQLFLVSGIFSVSLCAFYFVSSVHQGWRAVQWLGLLPAAALALGIAYVPESPKWLLQGGHIEEAKQTLQWLRPTDYDTDAEMRQLLAEAKDHSAEETTWAELLSCRTAMLVGCGLTFFQASTGINTVIFYSTSIFGLAGCRQPILGTTAVDAANLLATAAATVLVDRFGRRALLLTGTCSMLLSLLSLSLSLLLLSHSPLQGAVAVLAVLVFVSGFALGLGAVVWVVISEIIPTPLRTKAVSLFLCINWAVNLVISLWTLTVIRALGGVTSDMSPAEAARSEKAGVAYFYLIFAVMTAVCVCFVKLAVPETGSAAIGGSAVQRYASLRASEIEETEAEAVAL